MHLLFGPRGARDAQLSLIDAGGRLVRGLLRGPMRAGPHEVGWDCLDDAGHPVPAGLYLARLTSDGVVSSRKLVVLR